MTCPEWPTTWRKTYVQPVCLCVCTFCIMDPLANFIISCDFLQVKALPLFTEQKNFTASVGGQTLMMEKIIVYYVDEEPPTMTMKHLTGGIIAVIVVVVLAVIAGLLAVIAVVSASACQKCRLLF